MATHDTDHTGQHLEVIDARKATDPNPQLISVWVGDAPTPDADGTPADEPHTTPTHAKAKHKANRD